MSIRVTRGLLSNPKGFPKAVPLQFQGRAIIGGTREFRETSGGAILGYHLCAREGFFSLFTEEIPGVFAEAQRHHTADSKRSSAAPFSINPPGF